MRFLLLVLATALIGVPAAQCATWTGLGADSLVENAANWLGGLPANDGTETFTFFGSPRTDPTTQSDWFVRGIAFGPGAPPYVLQQNVFGISGGSLRVGSGGIANASSNAQTIEHVVLLEQANQTWTSTNATTRILNAVQLQNRVLTISGAGGVEIGSGLAGSNAIIGPGFVDVAAGAKLTLRGVVSADVDVLGGTLIVETDEPQPPGSVLQFDAGSSLGAIGVHNPQLALQLTGQTTFIGSGELQVQNGIRGTGSLVVDCANSGGTLGLGGFYLSPFTGSVAVHSGRLELNGAQPGVPMLTGPITIGDGVGVSDAELVVAVNGVVPADWVPTVQSDATLHLGDGVALIGAVLAGGALTSTGAYQVGAVRVDPSSNTATIDGAWNTPVSAQLDSIEVIGGTADPDLRFGAGRPGPGGLYFFGAGELLLDGPETTGEGRIRVDGMTCTLARSGSANTLPGFEANQSAIIALADQQFGSACELVLRGSSLDAGNNLTHRVRRLVLDNATVDNFRATIRVQEDIDVQTSSRIGTDLFFPAATATITIPAGQTLTMTGRADGQHVQVAGGGTLDCRDISATVSVSAARLRSTGSFGNLTVQSVLEIPIDGPDDELAADSLTLAGGTTLEMTLRNATEYSQIQAFGGVGLQGEASIAGTLNLALAPDASVAAGDVYELVRTGSLKGLFDTVHYPPLLAADEFWQLWYPSNDQQVLLERRSLTGASLDVTRGTRFVSAPTSAPLDTTRGVEMSVGTIADLNLTSVTVPGVTAPAGGSVGVEVYDPQNQTLVGSVTIVVAPSTSPQDVTGMLPVTLLQGTTYRIDVRGSAGITVTMRRPVRMPYDHSEVLRVLGGTSAVGSTAPPAASLEIPAVTLHLAGTATAVEPPPAGPAIEALDLRVAPNPFNPRTRVFFDLPNAGDVRIDVIDVRGRVVASLDRGFRAAGQHAVTFNGMDDAGYELSSGIYFIVLRSTDGMMVRKVALVR